MSKSFWLYLTIFTSIGRLLARDAVPADRQQIKASPILVYVQDTTTATGFGFLGGFVPPLLVPCALYSFYLNWVRAGSNHGYPSGKKYALEHIGFGVGVLSGFYTLCTLGAKIRGCYYA